MRTGSHAGGLGRSQGYGSPASTSPQAAGGHAQPNGRTDRPGRQPAAYYSGKHRRHGVNVHIVADPTGRLIWASQALPGPSTT